MTFLLGIFILTVLTSSTLAQYNYEPPLKHGGYIYSRPEVPFNEAPLFKPFSTLQTFTSAPKFVDKTPAQGYIYSKPNESFILPTPIKIRTSSKTPSNVGRLPTLSNKEAPTHVPKIVGYEYAHPDILFTYPLINSKTNSTLVPSQLPQSNGYSYPRPSSSFTLFPAIKTKESVLNTPTTLPKTMGYTYTHPLIPFIIPIKRDNSTTITTPQPIKNYSYITSTPSMNFTLAPSISSIPSTIENTSTRPAVPITIPPRIAKDKQTQLSKSKGYSYPAPKVSLTLPNIPSKSNGNLNTNQGIGLKTQPQVYTKVSTDRTANTMSTTPSTGYSYSPPKMTFKTPPKIMPTKSSKVQITYPTSSSSESITSSETNSAVPFKQVNGYVYSRPDIPFKTPTKAAFTISSSSVIQSTEPTKSLTKSNGYSYIPPSVTFTIPSRTPPTNHTPTKSLGYSYKTPKAPFTTPQNELLTMQKQTIKTPSVNSNYLGPPEVGYSYPKPAIPFGF